MRLDEWLATRTPPPPPALQRRVREAVGADVARDLAEAPELLLGAGERLLRSVLESECRSRAAALDLLAADALVTYALEAASEGDAARLADRARLAVIRIASLPGRPA